MSHRAGLPRHRQDHRLVCRARGVEYAVGVRIRGLSRRCRGVAGISIGLALLEVLSGCGGGDSARADPRNVILIVIDTLRADHLGCFGATRDTSPFLDELARQSTVFRRAYATAPWTIPSVATILTGLYPGSSRPSLTWSKLPEEKRTLPEILKDHGFRTAGIVSNFLIGKRFGFQQGFDALSETNVGGARHLSTDGVSSQAIEALERWAVGDGRLFLFVHYFDPHFAYMRHPEFSFADRRAGRLMGTESLPALRGMMGDLTAEEVGFLADLYDEEIRFTDAGVGRLLSKVREMGLLDDTLVVMCADHGEEFLDHGWLGHTKSLHEELIHVPLIIRDPRGGGRGRVIEEPVSLVSLAATILDLCGIDPATERFQGDSLADRIRGAEPSSHGPSSRQVIYSEVNFDSDLPQDRGKKANQKAVIVGPFKLLRDDDSGRSRLFHLPSDPTESKDLTGSRPVLARQLGKILERKAAMADSRASASETVKFMDDDIDRLRDLGYIDGNR